jgi:hypothetical protein
MTGGFFILLSSLETDYRESCDWRLEPLALLWEGHGEEVFDPDNSSHHDQDSGQVVNAL